MHVALLVFLEEATTSVITGLFCFIHSFTEETRRIAPFLTATYDYSHLITYVDN